MMLTYVHSLSFSELPNYAYIRLLLGSLRTDNFPTHDISILNEELVLSDPSTIAML